MFSIIATNDSIDTIKNCLDNVLYEKVGEFNENEIISILNEVSRINTDVLIIDIKSCYNDGVVLGLKQYRTIRSKTRIVIIAPNVIPGDMYISNIVKLGIYDIIAFNIKKEEEYTILIPYLTALLNKESSSYSDIARWDTESKTVNSKSKYNNKVIEKVVEVEKTVMIRQQVLSFYTTENNLVKETTLSNLAILLAKRSDQKVLVMDFNAPTPSLDHHFGVTKEIFAKDIYSTTQELTGVLACYSAIEKGVFTAEILKEFIKPIKKFKNLYLLTGLYDFNTFNKMGEDHYNKIIEAAKEIADTIIISLNPFLACTSTFTGLVNSNQIFIVSDGTYANMRASLSVVRDELINYHKFPKDKFKFIVTNLSERSLDKDTCNEILKGFKVAGYVKENKFELDALNNKKPLVLSKCGKKNENDYLNILSEVGYIPKIRFIDRFFKKRAIEGDK